VALLSSIAIVLAESEAAIVSVVATLLIAGLLNRKTRVLNAVILTLLTLLTLLTPPLLSKLTLQDYSGGGRLSQWSETIDMLQDHWLLGVGLSGYPTALEPYHKATHLEIFQYPHNIVLNIWVELGVLGLIAFVLLAYQVLVSLRAPPKPRAKRGGKQSSGGLLRRFAPRNDTRLVIFLALLQMTIHGLVDVPYFKNDLAILTWILLAIVFAYARPTTPTTKP
jgi:putative inorganic carbon (HCO3(-)) transporter